MNEIKNKSQAHSHANAHAHVHVHAQYVRITLCILLACLLVACASIPMTKPQAPNVTVADVRPTKLSFSAQTLELTLRVQNPNAFALPMESLDFKASFSGEEFAQGQSIEEAVIPANGEAFVKVEVKTGLGKLVNQFTTMLDTESIELNYGVTGDVKISNWPKPIPFNVEGDLIDTLTKSETIK